jgi:hypothetical protein
VTSTDQVVRFLVPGIQLKFKTQKLFHQTSVLPRSLICILSFIILSAFQYIIYCLQPCFFPPSAWHPIWQRALSKVTVSHWLVHSPCPGHPLTRYLKRSQLQLTPLPTTMTHFPPTHPCASAKLHVVRTQNTAMLTFIAVRAPHQ